MKGEKRLAGEPPEPPVISSLTPALAPFLLQAEPEPLEIDLQRTDRPLIYARSSAV